MLTPFATFRVFVVALLVGVTLGSAFGPGEMHVVENAESEVVKVEEAVIDGLVVSAPPAAPARYEDGDARPGPMWRGAPPTPPPEA